MRKNTRDLDIVDKKLLSSLRRNARTPISTLAKEVGISRRSAHDRVRRLEREGVISGYAARLSHLNDGQTLTAFFSISLGSSRPCSAVAADLASRLEVRKCYSVAGSIDLLVLAAFNGPDELARFREEISQLPAVNMVQTIPVLAEHVDGC